MILKTAMGIATNNLAASGDESLLVLVYAPTMIKPGYKPPKRTIVPRRPALLLLMPDPVNAWTWTQS
jgi:hypothetical protein